jgi:hypothetical protein
MHKDAQATPYGKQLSPIQKPKAGNLNLPTTPEQSDETNRTE